MNSDATSLDRLHDLVLPPAIAWWPLAPGWYVMIVLFALTGIWMGWRYWQSWQANAYRRAALRELTKAKDAKDIAVLLRRTALAVVPRAEVAKMTNTSWVEWLAVQSPQPMSDEVRHLLAFGVYDPSSKKPDIDLLRKYATRWVIDHKLGL